jgi:hypothetical protein
VDGAGDRVEATRHTGGVEQGAQAFGGRSHDSIKNAEGGSVNGFPAPWQIPLARQARLWFMPP